MKKSKFLLAAGLIVMAGATFLSCQKEVMQPKNNQVTVLKDVPIPTEMPLCNEGCLEDGPFYLITTSFTRQWAELSSFPGYYRNNKKIVVSTWNDADYFYVQTNVFGYQYDQTGGKDKELTGPTYNNYPFSTIIITLNGTVYTYEMDDPETLDIIETETEFIQSFPLPEGWEACTEMVYTVRAEGDGQPVWLGTDAIPAFYTYELYDYCGCDDYFALEDVSDCPYDVQDPVKVVTERFATFKFIAGEDGEVKIQGGLTNGATDIWITINDGTPFEWVNGHVITYYTGGLSECDEVVIEITWEADNEEVIDSWSVERAGVEVLETEAVNCEIIVE